MINIKTYVTTKSWVEGVKKTKRGTEFIQPFIPKGSGIVVISEKNRKVEFYHQGHGTSTMDVETFLKIPKIEKDLDDEYINDYIIPGDDIKNLNNLFKKLRKIYKTNNLIEESLETLHKWIFLTKGSSAIKGKEYENLNLDNLPWVKSNGFSSKPYHFNENRSGRTTVAPCDEEIELWSKNPYEVLPIGIKMSEHCSYSEIYKIGNKLFQEFCGIEGIDDQFKDTVKEFLPEINKEYEHYDYMTGKRITLDMFKKNTHHGKEKGLELSHLNPSVTFATTSGNITIGSSESNRKQSGNSIEEMAISGHNALRIQMGKPTITLDEYKMKILMDTI
jgi:hypothetical protein